MNYLLINQETPSGHSISMPKLSNEFYTVEYELHGEKKFACYFSLQSAQEAMMTMIKRGQVVNGLETKTLKNTK